MVDPITAARARLDAGEAGEPGAALSHSRLRGLIAELATALDHEQVARVAVTRTADELGAAAAFTCSITDGQLRLIAERAAGRDGIWDELARDAPSLSRVIAGGAPAFVSGPDEVVAAWPALGARAIPFAALAALPLVIEGRVLGGLVYAFREPQEFDRALYAALADHFALAMERVRLVAELARRADREAEQARVVETLLATSTILSSELHLDRLFEKLTDEATRLCRAQFGAFFYNTVDDAGEAYLLYTISGAPREAFSRFPSPRNTPLFAATFRGTGVVRMDDVRRDPRYGQNPPYHGMPEGHLPVRSYLAVPVISSSGEVLGGLFFGHAEVGVFREEDERLLVAVAAQGAIALDNARLYRDAQAARDMEERRARLAEEVGIALTVVAPFDDKLRRCVAALVERLDLAAAELWTADRTGGGLELRARAGAAGGTESARTMIGRDSALGRALADRCQLVLDPQDAGAAVPDWARLPGTVSFLARPLLVEERAVGVLALSCRRPLRDSTIQVAGTVADQVALAIGREEGERERERFRQLFIGMLGHDLRNPLSAVSTGAQALLLGQAMPERSAQAVQRIRASAARMGRMVNQLLDFARSRDIGTGIPLARIPADLHTVCRDVVEELRQSQPGRVVDEEYRGDTTGLWDVDRMAQVFSNLIGNALAYGDASRPIEVRVGREQEIVTAEVTSFGPPIAPEVLPTLFDPFRRAREGRTGRTEGLGLGLYITRQIILAHGGDLEASSTAEAGTTFSIRLPLVPAE
jgi:signal transduction histidine kinase